MTIALRAERESNNVSAKGFAPRISTSPPARTKNMDHANHWNSDPNQRLQVTNKQAPFPINLSDIVTTNQNDDSVPNAWDSTNDALFPPQIKNDVSGESAEMMIYLSPRNMPQTTTGGAGINKTFGDFEKKHANEVKAAALSTSFGEDRA